MQSGQSSDSGLTHQLLAQKKYVSPLSNGMQSASAVQPREQTWYP